VRQGLRPLSLSVKFNYLNWFGFENDKIERSSFKFKQLAFPFNLILQISE
jgi:hypothetical protein